MKQTEKRTAKRGRGGFTLIEILLVVAIIGMLGTIVAISIPRSMEKAKIGKAKADIRGLSVAINAYYMEAGVYPTSLSQLTEGEDPIFEKAIPLNPWNSEYEYAYPGTHKPYRYDLQTTMQDGTVIANWNMDEREATSTPKP